MKTCETCGRTFAKPPSLAYWQWEKQRFCSKTCVRRMLKPDDQLSPTYRYRRTKINGRPVIAEQAGGSWRPTGGSGPMPEIDRAEFGLLKGVTVALVPSLMFWSAVIWLVFG